MSRHLAPQATPTQPTIYEPTRETERLDDIAYVGRLFSSIRTHWRLFFGVFVTFVTLVTVGTMLVPKQYTATVKMIVGGAQNQEDAQERYSSLPVLNALALQSSDLSADTVADLVQEGPVVDKVIETLKIDQTRDQLLSHISVKPVLNTTILTLKATWKNPTQAAAIANTFSSVFVDRERDLISSQAVTAQNYLKQAISDAQSSLQQANSALTAYQAKSQIADITTQTQELLQRVEAAESKIAELQDDQKQAEAQLGSAQSQLSVLPATIAGQQDTDVNPTTTQLQSQLADINVQLATARARYTEKYPAVIALQQQRDQLLRQIATQPSTVSGQRIAIPNPVYQQLAAQAATLRGQIQGDVAQIAELQQQRKDLNPAIAALPAQTAKLGFLQEHAKLASDVYAALEQKYDNAVVAANSAISDVTVVQPADADNVEVTPSLLFNVLAGIVVGLMLALLAVAIADALQRRIREDRDVERVIGLPVIAHIPNMTANEERALPWLRTVTLEAFLHLCVSMRILGQKTGARVVVITSPEKGDGKTTIAFNLATAMSRIRSRVLLIDADMRCPAAHLQAQIENGMGLADVLSGNRSFEDTVVCFTPTLHLLTAGSESPNPVGLSESPSFDSLLELVREHYDCVVIDTPALGPVVDSVLIAARADATAIVLSANRSNEAAAGQAITRLRALGVDNVLGVIMNRTRTKFTDYSDYFASGPRASLPAPTPSPNGTAGIAMERFEDAFPNPLSIPITAPSVTIVIPAYNEGSALRTHLLELLEAFDAVRDFSPIDYIVVDDGSKDDTYEIARGIAARRDDVLVLKHDVNRGLGAALRTAFERATGTYVLTVDSDLSYSTGDLIRLLRAAQLENADVALASAYAKGGRVRGVPWLRAMLSREANRFLSLATGGVYATLTCMVRVYRRDVLGKLSFDVDGMDVNAHVALQALRVGARVVEIPATLQWPEQRKRNAGRASLRSICALTWRTMMCGLRHRPALALSIPGLIPGLLPAVVAIMLLSRCTPQTIVIGTAITMIIQYGSLAILGGQTLSFLHRRYVKKSPVPRQKAPHPHPS
ncbi:MAG: polysaccharide biosynthesis tyrosine autokinase [Candidatus Aquilonibacter sp.]